MPRDGFHLVHGDELQFLCFLHGMEKWPASRRKISGGWIELEAPGGEEKAAAIGKTNVGQDIRSKDEQGHGAQPQRFGVRRGYPYVAPWVAVLDTNILRARAGAEREDESEDQYGSHGQ